MIIDNMLADVVGAKVDFVEIGEMLQSRIFGLSKEQFLQLVIEIGVIPESIAVDSSEEKAYAKASDIVLARIFQELGLEARVIRSRSDCADVIAQSRFHSYSLVGDAKSFRLSRTAKNQKDFKVQALDHWREDNDFAVLVCPFYQYPRSHSQIYRQALDRNVLLLSWEHLAFMLEYGIGETPGVSLEEVWNMSARLAAMYTLADRNIVYWDKQDEIMCGILCQDAGNLSRHMSHCRDAILARCGVEVGYYERLVSDIKGYDRDTAIDELLRALKLREKIKAIHGYASQLRGL